MPRNPDPPTEASSPAKRPKLAHIADTMADTTPPRQPPGAPKIPFAPIATPTPTGTPSKGKAKEAAPPIPRSTFSTHNTPNHNPDPPRAWQPRCNHITMARIYHTDFRCSHCHRHGSFGWLYRCTQDRELLIQDVYNRGGICWWDDLGAMFAPTMNLGKWGPDKRSADPLAVLKEMGPDELRNYTPVQIAKLVEQRMEVQKALQSHLAKHGPDQPPDRSWVPSFHDECQYKICHACYRGGQDKATLSLNGILNGHIPPTAAAGLTYLYIGMRPALDAAIVANLGYRAVPMPRQFDFPSDFEDSSSEWSAMDLIDHHLGSSNGHNDDNDGNNPISSASAPSSNRNSQQRNPSGPVWWAAPTQGLSPPPVAHQRSAQTVLGSLNPPPGFAAVPNPQLVLGGDVMPKQNHIPNDLESRFGNLQNTYKEQVQDMKLALAVMTPLPPPDVHEWKTMMETPVDEEMFGNLFDEDDDPADDALMEGSARDGSVIVKEADDVMEEDVEEGHALFDPVVVDDGVAVTNEGGKEDKASDVVL